MESEIKNKIREQVRVNQHLNYREYLEALYCAAKELLKPYSYLTFSRDIGLSESNVARLVIRGKRRLGRRAAEDVARCLELAADDRHYFLLLVAHNNARLPEERERLFTQLLKQRSQQVADSLDKSRLEYFSEWYHPVIRELVGLSDFDPDPRWINSQIYRRLLPRQIETSLRLLERIGFVRFCAEQQRWVQTDGTIATAPEVRGIGLVRYHKEMLDMAKDSIAQVPPTHRSLNALTVRLNAENLHQAKTEIAKFVQRVLDLEKEPTQGDDIYQVNLQLFPMTFVGSRKREGTTK